MLPPFVIQSAAGGASSCSALNAGAAAIGGATLCWATAIATVRPATTPTTSRGRIPLSIALPLAIPIRMTRRIHRVAVVLGADELKQV